MQPKFQVFKGRGKQKWCFRLRGRNGKILAQSEGYMSSRNAKNGIYAIINCAGDADIEVV